MVIIPSIDISRGLAVKRIRGVEGSEIVKEDPMKVLENILKFSDKIKRIHIVDLDGAKFGKPINFETIIKIVNICKEYGIKVEVGGGIRKLEDALKYVENDCDIVLGSIVFKDLNETKKIFSKCGKDRIFVSIDVKGGRLAISGWLEVLDVRNVVEYLSNLDVENIIHTSIDVEGTMAGPKPYIELIDELKSRLSIKNLFYAGGVRDVEDVKFLLKFGFNGVIIGMAMYNKGLEHFLNYL